MAVEAGSGGQLRGHHEFTNEKNADDGLRGNGTRDEPGISGEFGRGHRLGDGKVAQ